MMNLKVATFFGCAVLAFSPMAYLPLFAQEEGGAEEPKIDSALENEIRYVEQLINYGFADFAEPVIAATKKKWPESDAQFFAFEIRSMLLQGKFDEAQAKIAALPDRTGSKYWAARLEVAMNYFAQGNKSECSKIYGEFFAAFPSAPKDPIMKSFYLNSSYSYVQILLTDKRYAEAVQRYEGILSQINKKKSDEDANTWCNIACEASDIYLRLAADIPQVAARAKYLDPAKKLVDQLLWEQSRPVYFGRAIAMKAHIELLKGNVQKAQGTIDDYMDQLANIHQQLVEFDPDGKLGMLRFSPMPQCRYMLADMLWKEALAEYKKPKRDDERIKGLMFGEKDKGSGKRNNLGAYNHALNVFIRYPESTWAAKAGDLANEIEDFAVKNYKAKITKQVTDEQMRKVRAMQFQSATELYAEGKYDEAIVAYRDALSRAPEEEVSITAIENIVNAYLRRLRSDKDATDEQKADWRLDADATEGYLAERFAGHRNRVVMTAAGDATLRLAAAEKQMGQLARADHLYREFLVNYRRHVNAATTAASMAGEALKDGKYEEAISLYKLLGQYYTNSVYYVPSFSQISYCHSKLGNRDAAIAAMKKYVSVETSPFNREQARLSLAQMYQKEGFDMVSGAETNETAEAQAEALKEGSKKIIYGIKEFRAFADQADKALKDPSVSVADKKRYSLMKEQSLFLIGDCWRRLTKPAAKIDTFRRNAAASYEEYLTNYPEGRYSTNSYVRLGTIYTALGDMEKSKDALDRLSKKFPDSLEAKNAKPQLAKSLIEMGLRKEGTEIYAEMLHTKDAVYSAGQFVNAGEALIDARSWELADEAFRKAEAKAGTNQMQTVARARLGKAKALYRQKNYVEARDSLDLFLADEKMSKMAMAADAYLLMVEVASEQGRTEKDNAMRAKHFGAAVGAVKKLRNYWKNKPQAEQDTIDLMSADIVIRRMKAEEAMGLKQEALDSCERAAVMLQTFLITREPNENHPIDKMSAADLANLERCYATMIPLFAKLGEKQGDRVLKFGQQYLDLFPNGKARTEVQNCINQAKAMGAEVVVEEAPAAEAEDETESEGESEGEAAAETEASPAEDVEKADPEAEDAEKAEPEAKDVEKAAPAAEDAEKAEAEAGESAEDEAEDAEEAEVESEGESENE